MNVMTLHKRRGKAWPFRCPVSEIHITAEMHVPTQKFVGTFACQDHLITRITHGAAEKILGYSMRINAEGLRLRYRIAEVICDIVLPYRNRTKLRTCLNRHLSGHVTFIVFSLVEGQRKGAYGLSVVPRCEAENCTGVDSAAKITGDWNVRAKADADSFVKRLAELLGVLGVGASRRGIRHGRGS